MHCDWLDLYGPGPVEWANASRETLPVARRLDALLALDDAPLSRRRPPARRVVGTCRDYALMLCAFVRSKGVPARVRCGFARYFGAGGNEDHWICEYWRGPERRWAIADAQLDAEQRANLEVDFDPHDVPASRFVFAGDAWCACRAGTADASTFGHGEATGDWFVRVNLIRDLLALGKREVSDWDAWRDVPSGLRHVDDAAAALDDEIASVASAVDANLTDIVNPPEAWRDALRPFWL